MAAAAAAAVAALAGSARRSGAGSSGLWPQRATAASPKIVEHHKVRALVVPVVAAAAAALAGCARRSDARGARQRWPKVLARARVLKPSEVQTLDLSNPIKVSLANEDLDPLSSVFVPVEAWPLARGHLEPAAFGEVLDDVHVGTETVESFVEPDTLVRVMAATGQGARVDIDIARLLDSRWRDGVPSVKLGPCPGWLRVLDFAGWGYVDLLNLSVEVGLPRVQQALQQPSMIEAMACLSSDMEFPLLDVVKAVAGAFDIHDMKALLGDVAPQWTPRKEEPWELPFQTTKSGLKFCPSEPPTEAEEVLLQLSRQTGGLLLTLPAEPTHSPAKNVYSLPSSTLRVLKAWHEFKSTQSSDNLSKALHVSGWGKFDIGEALESYRSSLSDSSLPALPTPNELRAHGYVLRLFPKADCFAQRELRRHLQKPESTFAAYLVRWHLELNGPLAARIDELECLDFSQEATCELSPKTHLRRADDLLADAPDYEEFEWLAYPKEVVALGPWTLDKRKQSERLQRAWTLEAEAPFSGWHFIILTNSHQVVMVGNKLHNCVRRSSYADRLREKTLLLVALSTSKRVEDTVSLGRWDFDSWAEIRDANNKVSPEDVKEAFKKMAHLVPAFGIRYTVEFDPELEESIRGHGGAGTPAVERARAALEKALPKALTAGNPKSRLAQLFDCAVPEAKKKQSRRPIYYGHRWRSFMRKVSLFKHGLSFSVD